VRYEGSIGHGKDMQPPLGGSLEQHTSAMVMAENHHLRVLIANEGEHGLAVIAALVRELGHEVVAQGVNVDDVGETTRLAEPDLAFVDVGSSSAHALELIGRISNEAKCPVIFVLREADVQLLREAARAGVFAYVVGDDPATWRGAIEIVLRRFADFHDLQGAFGRRAVIERAKGVLMERHGIREAEAFARIRTEARSTSRRVVDVSLAVVEGHRLLRRGSSPGTTPQSGEGA